MGNEISSGQATELETMKRFTGMSPGQVKLIKEKFELMADEDLTIDRNGFAQLMKLRDNEVDKVFQFFDLSNDGRIDSHEFVCALALLSQASLKEKSSILFSLYDFDHNRTITKNELVILIKTTLTSLGAMAQKGECSIQEAEKISDMLLKKYDTNKDSTISLQEFQSMISKDTDILKMLMSYGLMSAEDLRQDFGGADHGDVPDPDSDLEKETIRRDLAYDQKRERRKQGVDHTEGIEEEEQLSTFEAFQFSKRNVQEQWRTQVSKGAPSTWKPGKADLNPPATWLDMDYIYGFRCFDSRNNLKYLTSGEIAYPAAALGVVLDTTKNTQKFFTEHTDDITCIDTYDKLIATGQVGLEPTICVWEAGSTSKASFKGIMKQGVGNIAFSNDGKKLVAVGMDSDHLIIVYDVDKAMTFRGLGVKENPVMASGKGPKSFVFDVKFDKVDKHIILACRNEVYFATYDQQQIKLIKGLWDPKTCPIASVLCIGLVESNIITGTYKGYLLIWKSNRATQAVEAHTGPVYCMHTRAADGGLITGGKDGTIVFWDSTIKFKEKIVIANLNLKILNCRVCSVTEHPVNGGIIIGTRGSDIVEIIANKSRLVMRGHSMGNLRGLTTHPKQQMFYTIGEDNILACWYIKDRKMLSAVKLDYPSCAIHISRDFKYLAVGSTNGTVLIIDPKTLLPTFNFKDRDSEVSCIKFSHDGELLAVGHDAPSCDILIYSIKNHFKKSNVLRGSPARVISIDFSLNCRVLQVNDWSGQVIYYEIGGENNQKVQPDGALRNRDEKWSSYTAIYGWQSQGVWPSLSGGTDINAVDRSSKGDILVTADDYSSVKVFRYPVALPNQGYHRYVGHAAHVTMVRFSADDEYIISLGGADKTIIQWKVSTDKDTQMEMDQACDNIGDVQIQPEYTKISPLELTEETRQEGQMKQYLGPVKATAPTTFKMETNKYNVLPNGNLTLDYVLGFRTASYEQESFNMVKVLQDGRLLYTSGALAILLDVRDINTTCPQTYFKQHQEDIMSMALHPNGIIVATGGRTFALANTLAPICIWDSSTNGMLCQLMDFHLKSINAIEFSMDGVFLISVGADEQNSVAIHDWQINQLLCIAKTGNSPVYSISVKSYTEFMVCGLKSVKFFNMNGRNLKCMPGSLGGGQFEPMICSCAAFMPKEYVTGSINGNIFIWRDNQSSKSYKAHDGKVASLVSVGKHLYSAGLDGKIILWEYAMNQLQQVKVVVIMNSISKSQQSGIISLNVRNHFAVVATKGAELYKAMMPELENLKLVIDGHSDGEVWGIAISPNGQQAITCGGDSVLRLWDLNTYKMVMFSNPAFDNDVRACDWSKDGHYIVVGDVKGFIYLIDPSNLALMDKKNSKFAQQKTRNNQNWIQDIKISPDNQKVAFGAHGTASHLEVWEIEQNKLTKQSLINLSLQGSLIHLDWSTDSIHITVNSSNYELKFVNVLKGKDVPGPTVKDLDWHTWTCILGFPTQGILSGEEYNNTSVCASHSREILAVGEYRGLISLYKYPAVCQAPQMHKEYTGHASCVSRLKFTPDDSKLISTSSLDRSIFIWKTDFGKQQQLEEVEQQDDKVELEDDTGLIGLLQEKHKRKGGEKYGKINRKDGQKQEQNEEEIFGMEQQDKGDEFTVIRPWMGAVKEPSNYYKDPLNQNKQPMIDLTLEYVHGYRHKDCRNNVKYAKNGNIIYNTAALGVSLDPTFNTQKFFQLHNDDVISIDISTDGMKVATGEVGCNPSIYVWDTNTQTKICYFKGQFRKGVISLAFNSTGDKLAAVGLDDRHTIAIYDVMAKTKNGGALIIVDQVGTDVVTDLKWKSDTEFATVGIHHFRIWKLHNGGLTQRRGILGKAISYRFLCVAPFGDDYLVGGIDGALSLYKENKYVQHVQCQELGKPLEAITVTKDYIITGGKDSKIVIIDPKNLKIILQFKLNELIKFCPEIKSLQLAQDQRTILLSTNGGEIYEILTKDAKINANSKFQQIKPILKAHYCPNKRSLNEVWGLAVNPQDQDQYYTCGDDGTLRVWSISQHKQLNFTRTNVDSVGGEIKADENGDLPDSTKGRTITVSPDGIYVVVGFKDGTFRMYDKELKQKLVMRVAKEWISDMKFSQDSQWLAIGSHDNTVYLYSFPEMKLKNKPLKKHSSYITHIDFSCDGNYLHSNCGAYELLFWDVNQGRQLPNGASALRDEKWLTWTCTLGWPVQGIWSENQDGTDINAACRTNQTFSNSDKPPDNYHLIATGDDDSKIKIFRYPCVKKGSQAIIGKGHSSHVTNVAWSVDDSYLFSTGGEDNSVFQWRVTKLK